MEFRTFDELPGPILIERDVHEDDRGRFVETWHEQKYHDRGLGVRFVQANSSHSRRGVLRGLHFQHPRGQGKLVSVTRGAVYDVAVDVRAGSPTFARWIGVRLSSANGHQLFVPPDFAHGFVVISESADLIYQCTDFYDPHVERTLLWNDPGIGVDWPVTRPTLSPKDAQGESLEVLRERELLPEYRVESRGVGTW